MEITFKGQVMDLSGYAELNRSLIKAMEEVGIGISLWPVESPPGYRCPLDEKSCEWIIEMEGRDRAKGIIIQCVMAQDFIYEKGSYNIGFTMFEADRINRLWVQRCNMMDEIWVPSLFNYNTFTRSGVDRRKIHVMQLGVDTDLFRPGHPPLYESDADYVFLSNFEIYPRKGYDILIRAFLEEFRKERGVMLLLKVRSADPKMIEGLKMFIINARRKYGSMQSYPRITVISRGLSREELPRLYASADSFVLPTRGEGWSMTCCEAMACGLPVITTNWSAHLEYVNSSNAYLIDITGLERIPRYGLCIDDVYSGACWAKPDIYHLRRLMRQAFTHRELAKRIGERARNDVASNFTWRRAAERISVRLEKIGREVYG